MKLRIRHDTVYRYRRAVVLQPRRLLLMPRGTHELRVLASSLDLSPRAEVEWTQDVFGNLVATARFASPADELVISGGRHCRAVRSRLASLPDRARRARLSVPLLRR